jgi:hypothetical protein
VDDPSAPDPSVPKEPVRIGGDDLVAALVRASESDILIRRSQMLRAQLKQATDVAAETCRSAQDLRDDAVAAREAGRARR